MTNAAAADLMDVNIRDTFQSITVLSDAQIVPSMPVMQPLQVSFRVLLTLS